MTMGNTIIRASHVGTRQHHVSPYYGTPTDEDVAITKRAAMRTKQRWAEERKQKQKKSSGSTNVGASKQSVRPTRNPQKNHTQPKQKIPKTNKKTKRSRLQLSKSPAKILGISDEELSRRISATIRYRLGVSINE